MRDKYILLATPQIIGLMKTDLTLLGRVLERIITFLSDGMSEAHIKRGAFSYTIQKVPYASIFFLGSNIKSKPDFLILYGAGDGLGPTHLALPCKAKGIFPTRDQIRAGEWLPLERIRFT